MKVSEATFNSIVFRIQASASSSPEFVDITDQVIDRVRESDVRNGFVVVYSRHTTAAIVIQENEPLLIEDMKSTIERMAPRNAHYRHNDFTVRDCPHARRRMSERPLPLPAPGSRHQRDHPRHRWGFGPGDLPASIFRRAGPRKRRRTRDSRPGNGDVAPAPGLSSDSYLNQLGSHAVYLPRDPPSEGQHREDR